MLKFGYLFFLILVDLNLFEKSPISGPPPLFRSWWGCILYNGFEHTMGKLEPRQTGILIQPDPVWSLWPMLCSQLKACSHLSLGGGGNSVVRSGSTLV